MLLAARTLVQDNGIHAEAPAPTVFPPLHDRRMLAKRLPIPAYDHLLKLSHTFNILDARGAVGVTERANCFATMRALAREVTGE